MQRHHILAVGAALVIGLYIPSKEESGCTRQLLTVVDSVNISPAPS